MIVRALALTLVATSLTLGVTLGPSAVPTAAAATATCSATTPPTEAFTPTKAVFVSLKKSFSVVKVRRTSTGAIGTPPLTDTGKHLVGWDPAVKPAGKSGVVILDAHTWPDGTALGNLLLSKLHTGGFLRVQDGQGHFACYQVTKRQEWPRQKVPTQKIFSNTGAQKLVIIVCSGKRVGPENWLDRTVWTAQIVGR